MERLGRKILVALSLTCMLSSRAQPQAALITRCLNDRGKEICDPREFTKAAYNGCMQQVHTQCVSELRQGVVYPKYYILTLVYAPPGCTTTAAFRCSGNGIVDYQSGSSTGTKVSTQESFTSDTGLSVDAGISKDESKDGVKPFSSSLSLGFSNTVTDGFSETIAKTQTLDIKVQALADGIDHGQDLFFLLLNPAVSVIALGKMAQWNLGFAGDSAQLYRLSVSELKNPGSMPKDVADELRNRGFTNEDFQTILAQDPFSQSQATVDPVRFVPTTLTFPYEPPDSASCPGGACTCASITSTIKNDFAREVTRQYQSKYSTSASIGVAVPGLNLKDTESWTWTNTSSKTSTTGSSNSASVTISCPSFNYEGPTLMSVYWDTLYGSFVFSPTQTNPAFVIQKGHVSNGLGKSVQGQLVGLTIGRKIYHTFTDKNGGYRFDIEGISTNGRSPQKAILSIGRVKKRITIASSAPSEIRLK
jgi:hypothetical protein